MLINTQSCLGKSYLEMTSSVSLGFERKREWKSSNLDCCSREEEPVACVHWVEIVFQNDLSVS